MASKLYKEILIATGDKESTRNAIDYGIELARVTEARLHVIFVIDTASSSQVPLDADWESASHELKQLGEEVTKYIADSAQAKGLKVIRYIVEGHPVEEIMKYANRNSVDLIILGKTQKRWLDRFLLGSVSENVVRSSKIPVLVAPF